MFLSIHLKRHAALLLGVLMAAAPAHASAHCAGDVDGVIVDGRVGVDVFDFAAFVGSFGAAVPPGTAGDLNGSGFVDIFDFAELAGSFGCVARVDPPGTVDSSPAGFDDPGVSIAIADDVWNQMFASMTLQGQLKASCDSRAGILLSGEDCNANGMDDTIDLSTGVGVSPHSGEVVVFAVEIPVKAIAWDFAWCRTYRSRLGASTAMGNGWDHSYNIFVEASGADLVLHDGHARADLYENQAPGLWIDEEFFCTLEGSALAGFTLTFPHGETWTLHPLDGSPAQGRIAAITDLNGNTMTFDYDPMGRLSLIADTLDDPGSPRQYTVLYNADDRVDTIVDFAGRQVHYEYYDGIEPGGSLGDLKSVTTPAVTGTPNGNDFPLGKTTTYTYSTGFANDRLNHNLLTITDPKGQTSFVAQYGATIAPADLEFDRVTRLTVGDPGDVIDLVYTQLVPAPANGFSTIRVTANDRVGNVCELYTDDDARPVLLREFTGRGDPDLPTDIANGINLPVAPVRLTDPTFFESRFEWNADSRCTRVVRPNQNETIFVYDEPNPDRRAQGNMLSVTRLPGPLGGDQASITESWQYDPIINFGTNFPTRHTDARAHNTDLLYDPQGNVLHITHRIPGIVEDFEYNTFGQLTRHILPDNGSGHRREDAFTYYTPADGCMYGHLRDRIVDDTGLALTTTYEYDCIGRITRTIDPRGADTIVDFNALDQPVRVQSREVTTVFPVRYERLFWYDANDNVIRIDVSNHDDQGILQPNTHFSTIYEYDILNRVTRVCDEKGSEQLDTIDDDCGAVDPNEFVSTEYDYDANRNRTELRFGEATNGNDPDNRVRLLYDERDLVFEHERAPLTPDQVTTRYDYDGNRNRVVVTQGLEAGASPHYAGDAPRVTVYAYDGYDRLLRLTDPMDNVHICEYDAAGNRTRSEVQGEPTDAPGDAGNVRLAEQSCDYDDMDRCTECRTEHFDTASQLPIGDGQSTQSCTYNDCSQALSCTDDNAHTTSYAYDTANRCSSITDARGNSVVYVYDANSNVAQTTETDKSDLGNPDEVFVSLYDYDALDRLTLIIDPVGNTGAYLYDSRSNQTQTTDPRGNLVRFAFDGLDRCLSVARVLTDTGDGGGIQIGAATTAYEYDDSSRLVRFDDANAHSTIYTYDSLDRRIVTTRADGTLRLYAYDTHDNVLSTMDPNQTLVDLTYDLDGRCTRHDVLVGPSVSSDTTLETYSYDGLSRLVDAQDDDSLVTFAYDSLGNRTSESLAIGPVPAHVTTSLFDGVGNLTLCVYPSGRQLGYQYDAVDRVIQINDGVSPHVMLERIGAPRPMQRESATVDTSMLKFEIRDPGCDDRTLDWSLDWSDARIERMSYANGTQSDFTYDGVANAPGDFGVRKIVGIDHSITLGPPFDQRSFKWDSAGNRSSSDILLGPPQLQTTYEYDSIYRLTRTTEVDPATTGIRRATDYALDDAGNRTSETGSLSSGAFLLDPTLPNPADAQVNQYTLTPALSLVHDDNGNRSQSTHAGLGDQSLYEFDYLDRLISVVDVPSGDTVEFAYDAIGRRIEKVSTPSIGPPATERFYYCSRTETAPPLLIEERDASDTPVETYVRYNDLRCAFVTDRGGSPLSFETGGQSYFYHCDDLGSTLALTDQFGAVVERYSYDDYGRVLITTNAQEADEPQGAIVSDVDPIPFGASEEIAENVELGSRRLTAIRWWGGYSLSLSPADHFNIRIYADGGGMPGPLLYEELNVTQVGRKANTLSFGKPEFVYTYALARPFEPPAPGQYWLSIQNDTSANSSVAWAWTISTSGDGQLFDRTGPGPFLPGPYDVAFELYTDQSGVGNPYLFHGMRYDVETSLFVAEDIEGSASDADQNDLAIRYSGRCAYMDPDSGRFITRLTIDTLGNGFAYAGNNPVSGVGMFRKILDRGEAGDSVGLHLRGITKDPIKRGQVICKPGSTTSHLQWRVTPPSPWLDVFTYGRHSTSSSLGMAFAHVDCPGHADYVKNMTATASGPGGTYVLKKEEGGRHTPFHNKYRPQFYLRTTDVTGATTLRCDTILLDPGVVLRANEFAIVWMTGGPGTMRGPMPSPPRPTSPGNGEPPKPPTPPPHPFPVSMGMGMTRGLYDWINLSW